MSSLIVGSNSYASVADADAFLATSVRAASLWAAISTATKEAALVSFFRMLENQTWAGTPSALAVLATAALNAGGASYAAGQILTVSGGTVTAGREAKIRVLTVSSGAVATFEIADVGDYMTAPTSPVSVSSSPGSGATFNVTFGVQATAWPRANVTDRYGVEVSSTAFPAQIVQANIQGAFELSQDPSIETKKNEDSNISALKAGSVGINYFAPQLAQGRFPSVVQELVAQFLAGAANGVTASADGFSSCSDFSPERYQFTEGLP